MVTYIGNALCCPPPSLPPPPLPPPPLPIAHLRSSPEFAFLVKQDRSEWSRCLLWHGWLPGLSPRQFGTPCAVAAGDLASNNLESSLGAYPLLGDTAWCSNGTLRMFSTWLPTTPTFGRMVVWSPSPTLTYVLPGPVPSPMPLLVFSTTLGGTMHRIMMSDLMAFLTSSPPSLAHCTRLKGRSFWESFLSTKPSLAFPLVLIASVFSGVLPGCLSKTSRAPSPHP